MTASLNFDDLRYMLAVAETGTTLAASKMLRVSQSTVSRRIAALEDALQVELFDKRRTGYFLTEAGSLLLAPAEAVRQAVDAFSGAVDSLSREISGTVRFTTNEVLGSFVLPRLIERLRQRHPGVKLEVDTTNVLRDLVGGEADVALRASPAPTQGVPRRVEDLAGHAIIGIDAHVRGRPIFDWATKNFPAEVLLRHNSVPAVFTSVRNGVGVGFYSDFVAAGDPELVFCFRPPVPPAAEVWLVTDERLRHVPRVRAVMDVIKELVKEISGQRMAAAVPA